MGSDIALVLFGEDKILAPVGSARRYTFIRTRAHRETATSLFIVGMKVDRLLITYSRSA